VARSRRGESLPRRVATVYAQIARIYRTWGGSILLLALVIFVPLGLIDAAAAQLEPSGAELTDGFKVAAVLAGAGAVTTTGLLGEVFFAGAIAISLTHPEHERPPPLRHIAREIRYWRLIAIDILFVLIVAVGLLLAIVPGIAAFVLLGLAGPAVELEHHGVRGALARSFRLVRSDFWLVFWVLVPVEVFGDAVGDTVDHLLHHLLGAGFFSTWLAEAASNIVLSPLFAVAAVLLAVRLITAVDGSGPRIRSLGASGDGAPGATEGTTA
jgi:hypothetical protein